MGILLLWFNIFHGIFFRGIQHLPFLVVSPDFQFLVPFQNTRPLGTNEAAAELLASRLS